MAATRILLTAEQFDNYPFEEDKRYELDEGELIEMTRPAYKHNRIMNLLNFELMTYFRANPIGETLPSENLYAIDPRTRLAPDLAVILGNRRMELENATVIRVIPEIVIEILSPMEQMRRTHRKLKQYFDAGVKEVWVIDPESRTAEIWTAPALSYSEVKAEEPLTSPLLPEFSVPLAKLFD